MTLIGSWRTNVSILGVILVVAAITASLLIWQRSATPLPAQLSTDTSARPALDQHERHPAGVPRNLHAPLDQHERHSQAGPTTCRPVGPDERAYVGALLTEMELQRYLDIRQCPPAR
jgi:hypothetical protein